MFGIMTALTQFLLQGQQRGPQQAKEVGLIDEVVSSVEELVPAAKAWIKDNPESGVQPWDVKGYKIPGAPRPPRVRREPAGLPGEPA